jgi:SAM-dependent methyltransferase
MSCCACGASGSGDVTAAPPLTIWDYSGITAAAYDQFFGDEPYWDQAFYSDRIASNGGRALELACGTGRLLVPYLRDGLDVEGLDTSIDMLALLRAKAERLGLAPGLHQLPMQDFHLPGRYRTIFCPAGSFRILLSDAEILASLRCCLAALEPGGELLIPFDVMVPPAGEETAWRERRHVQVPAFDAEVRIFERNGFDPARGIVQWYLRWEVVRNGATEVFYRDHALRHHSIEGFTALLLQAGFAAVQTRRGYTDPQSSSPEDDVIFLARRPS